MTLTVRPAAVAGMFYPESAMVLEREVGNMLAAAAQRTTAIRPKAIISSARRLCLFGAGGRQPLRAASPPRCAARFPASYCSSRRTASPSPGWRARLPRVRHAVESFQSISTRWRPLPICRKSSSAVMRTRRSTRSKSSCPSCRRCSAIFRYCRWPSARLPQAVAQVLERLWGGDETLIVVSSDLSHYLPYAQARRIDAQTAQAIVDLDAAIDHRQPAARRRSTVCCSPRAPTACKELCDLRNSGDTAGDRTRVVGYGAFAFSEAQHHAQSIRSVKRCSPSRATQSLRVLGTRRPPSRHRRNCPLPARPS